jgi:serine phosphatase RsbU (regulator of sigma subunit)
MGDEGGNGAERRLSTQLQTLNQLAMTLNSETDPGRMLDEVLAGALRLTGAAGGSFYLVDAGALRLEAFTLAVSSGERSSAGRSGVSDAKDLARKALAEQRMIRVPPTGSGGGSGPGYLAVPLVTWDGGELACLVLTGLGRESAFSAEDEVLTATLAAHTSVALQNAQRLARERETAEYLQRAMLPEAVRPVGLEIEWAYESATDATLVGGDFYDVLPLSGGRTALVVGDVSGKGLVAATRMATVRHMFRAFVPLDPGPGEWLRLVSEGIASSLTSSEFVTATLVVVDPERGHMECAIAGHPAPLVALPSGVTEIEVEPGLPLGMGRQWAYADRQMDLPQGCTLILYTDGLYEARNGGRMFGADRLEAAARALASAPLSGAADRLVAEARVHAGGSLSDDVVVVLARPRTSSRR